MARRIEFEGSDDVHRGLVQLERAFLDPRPLLERVGAYGASSSQRRIAGGMDPENAPLTRAWKKGSDTTLRDTGKLQGSITHRATRRAAAWGTNEIQARLLHEGGTVRPRKAKKLAIPAGWKVRRLMRRYGETPGSCIEAMRSSGDYAVWTSRSGKAVLAKRKTAAGKAPVFVLFILKDSVTVPARPFLRLDDGDRAEIDRIAKRYLTDAVS